MSLDFFNKIKRKLNLHIVLHTKGITGVLRILNLIVSLVTIASICYYHGFYATDNQIIFIHGIVVFSLAFYILKFILYFIYSIQKKQYLKDNFFEGIILGIFLLQFIVTKIFHYNAKLFDTENFNLYYVLFIQLYFLFISGIEILKSTNLLSYVSTSPPKLMVFSFFILITFGTGLLLMPRMTTHGISFVNALFTATSASCVTGLTVLNSGIDFTFRGQVIIMLLIQFGGLSILTFASFFITFISGSHLSLRQEHFMQDMLFADKRSDSKFLLRGIIRSTLVLELVGILLLFILWNHAGYFSSKMETIFHATFHTVSAFNNAGFVLWNDEMFQNMLVNNDMTQVVIIFLVLCGGIGFFQLRDAFNFRNIRERRRIKWKQLLPGTKIIFKMVGFIVLFGTFSYFILEFNNTLGNESNVFEKFLASLFQIVSSRTAGFSIFDLSQVALPTLLLIMVWMFIGGAPGSTAGGVKVTTAFVIYKSVIATIRGKQRIEFQKRTIPFNIVDRAYSIVIMSILIIMIATFSLTITDPYFNFSNILFESISAFSTCGLSTGITPYFSSIGKYILVLLMFVGRIGTLTIAFAISNRSKESSHQYPTTSFMVG